MRHIGSLIAGILVAVAAWILIGLAQSKLLQSAVTGISTQNWARYGLPLLFLAIAGLLIGLITATRISPVGPLIAGAAYVLLQLAYVTWPAFLDWLPGSLFGESEIWTRPLRSGIFAVLGVAMLTAVLSLRRWQRWPSGKPPAHSVGGHATAQQQRNGGFGDLREPGGGPQSYPGPDDPPTRPGP